MCCTAISCFFFSSRRRHTRLQGDWSSDVCSSDLGKILAIAGPDYVTLRDVATGKAIHRWKQPPVRDLPIGSNPVFAAEDRKSTRLNSSHLVISYAVFCLKKKTTDQHLLPLTPQPS